MEIKQRLRQAGLARRLAGSFLVFAVTAGMVAATPGLNGAAKAVNLEEDCTLKVAPVDPDKTELSADLAGADITVDLYKVADAQSVSGYDTYTYQFLEGYQGLESIYKADPNNAEWKKMAQEAASHVKGSLETAGADAVKPYMSVPVRNGYAEFVGSDAIKLKSGLYLLIARETGAEDYWTTVRQQGDAEEGEAEESIATVARSERYVYTYSPEMVSLPGKEGNTTAGNGEWLYNMTAFLKPEQSLRYGSLEIVKTLLSYEGRNPATFVFHVVGMLGDEKVFDDTVSLVFTPEDGPGVKSVVLEDRIPVGTVVTVTEEYSGGVYEQTSVSPDPVVIAANDIVSVAFTNDYNETDRGGGSVTNSFNQSETGWRLQQNYDDGRVEEQGNE